jgi:hypothetical protein
MELEQEQELEKEHIEVDLEEPIRYKNRNNSSSK